MERARQAYRELALEPQYILRLRQYYENLSDPKTVQSEEAKSDYWKLHSARASIEFDTAAVRISGDSGFYIPPDSSNLKFRLIEALWRVYKKLVLSIDRWLRLSTPYYLNTFLPAELAYDYIFQKRMAFEVGCYVENPHRFDFASAQPRFATAEQLRREWFLRDRYAASAKVVHTALYHTIFAHFLGNSTRPTYLEIGAGNGNLASFFHYYHQARVTIIDLPETILFSASYLKSIFPDAKILLPHEAGQSLTSELLRDYDFIFLLPNQASELPSASFNLIVNLFSMQEMTSAQIDGYFHLIQRVARSGALWCNVNRVEKFCNRTERPMRAYEFPYNAQNHVLVHQIDEFLKLTDQEPHMIHIERL